MSSTARARVRVLRDGIGPVRGTATVPATAATASTTVTTATPTGAATQTAGEAAASAGEVVGVEGSTMGLPVGASVEVEGGAASETVDTTATVAAVEDTEGALRVDTTPGTTDGRPPTDR